MCAAAPVRASSSCCTDGPDAVLGGSAARRRRDRLRGAGEVEQVRALGVIEMQCPGERVENAVGGAGEVAALQPRVVRNAHAGQDRDLLATKAGHAAGAVVGQADVGGLELGSPGSQEVADLAAGVHRRDQRRPRPGPRGDPARVTFTGSLDHTESVLSWWP